MLDDYATLCHRTPMASNGRLLTTGQVARQLGLHLRKVQRMVESGEIPVAETVGGRHLIDASVADYKARELAQEAKSA